MNKPWDIKADDTREANVVNTFIIFCEDEVSEPLYFRHFQTADVKVNCIAKQKSMMDNVINAIDHCETSGLMEYQDGAFKIQEGLQVWCVFDRDKEETPDKIRRGNIAFDESIQTAKRRGIKVAWSNDAFELWVLLHFQEVELTAVERTVYYDELTAYFRNLPNKDDYLYLQKALNHASFNYKQDLKTEKNFRFTVRPEMLKHTKAAIARAKALEANYTSKNIQNHKKAPCTLVHHLVEEIVKQGGKVIL